MVGQQAPCIGRGGIWPGSSRRVPSLTKWRQGGWVVGIRIPGLIAGAGVGCGRRDWAGPLSTIYDGNLTPPGLGGALSSFLDVYKPQPRGSCLLHPISLPR